MSLQVLRSLYNVFFTFLQSSSYSVCMNDTVKSFVLDDKGQKEELK